jgi:signal transduction histidine kinase
LMRAQMGELNAQLSHRVGELKTALLHAEAATARAERATKVKDEFIATMSHELRTPLNAVINIPRGLAHDFRDVRVAECHACAARFVLDEGERTDGLSCPDCKTGPLGVQVMLRYRGEPERSLRFLRSVERCGMHLLQMVNGILDISIMDAGRLTLQREHTELGPLIEDAIEELQSVAQARGIVLSAELVQTDEAAVLDPVRIKQVLHNLLSNAVKFSPDGGRVSLRWTRERRGDTIAIEDHGVGIAPENQARIFARFEQVHVGETRKYGGTGLGLSIARSLVRMHGGELWVTSELGRGSTFTFHLPHVSSVPSLSLAHELSAAPTQSGLRARSGAVRPSRVTRS